MEIKIGDKILYKDEDRNGVYFTGEILDIWQNGRNKIVGYFAALNSGLYVHIQPSYIEIV